MKTNRDLYKSIASLLKEKSEKPLPFLEDYLSNLLALSQRFADRNELNLEECFSLLREAFDEGTISTVPIANSSVPAFKIWQTQIEKQVQDLKEMAQQGQLENKYRYFGISAPSGRYWYNFDPYNYIECGVAGAFDGWAEEDDTGRSYVLGPVACLDPDGKITSCDPRELDRAPVEIPSVTWEMLIEFAWCGQNYE